MIQERLVFDVVDRAKDFVIKIWWPLILFIVMILGWVWQGATLSSQVKTNALNIMPKNQIQIKFDYQDKSITEVKLTLKEMNSKIDQILMSMSKK
jgi:hypothetical protein